jgi:SAM-dependent methyltransferase
MTDTHPVDPPSPFIEEWVARLSHEIAAPRRALDLAMGRGRHAQVMAASGWHVFGVDLNPDTVAVAVARASQRGYQLRGWCADLTVSALPARRFELIVVTRYLQRDLCGAIANALVPGGIVLFETFTELQRARGLGPTSPDHLLKSGELPSLFAELESVFYEEVADPAEDALARLAARRRSSPS